MAKSTHHEFHYVIFSILLLLAHSELWKLSLVFCSQMPPIYLFYSLEWQAKFHTRTKEEALAVTTTIICRSWLQKSFSNNGGSEVVCYWETSSYGNKILTFWSNWLCSRIEFDTSKLLIQLIFTGEKTRGSRTQEMKVVIIVQNILTWWCFLILEGPSEFLTSQSIG